MITYDGTGRPPRSIQLDALKLSSNFISSTSKVLGMTLPCGVGKSYIARCIQLRYPETVILVPSNHLMDQYIETYPDLNYIKGKEHYQCSEFEGLTCIETQDLYDSKCINCALTQSRKRAAAGEPTIYNPISYYYYQKITQSSPPKILVIDEAHKLKGMIDLLVDYAFRKSKYNYPDDIDSEVKLIEWLDSTLYKLSKILNAFRTKNDIKSVSETYETIKRIQFIKNSYSDNPQDFHFYEETRTVRNLPEKYLIVKPVKTPNFLLKQILAADKIILMSATLLPSNLWDLGLYEHIYRDFPSPIPKENRSVQYAPFTSAFKYDTDPMLVANWIKSVLAKHPNVNTIVHVSYGWSKKLEKFFPGCLFNLTDNKTEVIERFKKEGGIFFAAGCSEGIDLPDDLCRLIIIPIIFKSNPNDPLFKKKQALPNGYIKSQIDAMQTVIQQAGRASRHIGDKSLTVIGDSAFPSIFNKTSKFLPLSFRESIKWGAQ